MPDQKEQPKITRRQFFLGLGVSAVKLSMLGCITSELATPTPKIDVKSRPLEEKYIPPDKNYGDWQLFLDAGGSTDEVGSELHKDFRDRVIEENPDLSTDDQGVLKLFGNTKIKIPRLRNNVD